MKTGLFKVQQFSLSERRRHSQGDGIGNIKGKGKKGTSPSGLSNKPVCAHFQRTNDKRNPYATIGAHQDAHITNPKVDAKGGTRVYSSIQATVGEENMVKEQFP